MPSVNYVALVSGMRLGDESRNPLPLQMAVDYISGHLGSNAEQTVQANVVRLIVAGNSVVPPEDTPEGSNMKNYQKVHTCPNSPFAHLSLSSDRICCRNSRVASGRACWVPRTSWICCSA